MSARCKCHVGEIGQRSPDHWVRAFVGEPGPAGAVTYCLECGAFIEWDPPEVSQLIGQHMRLAQWKRAHLAIPDPLNTE